MELALPKGDQSMRLTKELVREEMLPKTVQRKRGTKDFPEHEHCQQSSTA
jgi:hypothetical protein